MLQSLEWDANNQMQHKTLHLVCMQVNLYTTLTAA